MTRIRKEYEGAQRREALLTAAYAGQARAISGKAEETAHYSLLKREVDASRLLYENLLQKLKESSIASALRANNIRVVDAAQRPARALQAERDAAGHARTACRAGPWGRVRRPS